MVTGLRAILAITHEDSSAPAKTLAWYAKLQNSERHLALGRILIYLASALGVGWIVGNQIISQFDHHAADALALLVLTGIGVALVVCIEPVSELISSACRDLRCFIARRR